MTSRFGHNRGTLPQNLALAASGIGLLALAWLGILGQFLIGLVLVWVVLAFIVQDRPSWRPAQPSAGPYAVVSHLRYMRNPFAGIGWLAVLVFCVGLMYVVLNPADLAPSGLRVAATVCALAAGWMGAAALSHNLSTLVIDEQGIRREGVGEWQLPWQRISRAELTRGALQVSELRAGPNSDDVLEVTQSLLRDASRSFRVPASDQAAVRAVLDRYNGSPQDQITEGPQ